MKDSNGNENDDEDVFADILSSQTTTQTKTAKKRTLSEIDFGEKKTSKAKKSKKRVEKEESMDIDAMLMETEGTSKSSNSDKENQAGPSKGKAKGPVNIKFCRSFSRPFLVPVKPEMILFFLFIDRSKPKQLQRRQPKNLKKTQKSTLNPGRMMNLRKRVPTSRSPKRRLLGKKLPKLNQLTIQNVAFIL